MKQELVKVTKNGSIKTIYKKDLKDYVAAGWKEVSNATANPFANTQYSGLNTTIKK